MAAKLTARTWRDVTVDELTVFFALLLAGGSITDAKGRDRWAGEVLDDSLLGSGGVDRPRFGGWMSRNRFYALSTLLPHAFSGTAIEVG
jgi:hypothetical protein